MVSPANCGARVSTVLAAVFAAGVALCNAGAQAQQRGAPPDPADLLMVLNAALYPVEVMAYCYRVVAPDPAFQAAGNGWVMRNGDLLGRLQALATTAGISNDQRLVSDRQTLADIEKLVGRQTDQAA
jgi:hypothetical protein